MRKTNLLQAFGMVLLFLIVNVSGYSQKIKPEKPWKNVKNIDKNWLYLERDTKDFPNLSDEQYVKIDLPHTWNAIDVLQTKDYRRGSSWYRKYINIKRKQLDNRLYIRFGAAGQEARVFFNGKELIYHNGGYSAFTCEITDFVKVGDNVVDVWVSNKREPHIAPQTADYNFYGGLYRSVELITAPKLSFSRKTFGGPGVRVWSKNINRKKADLHISAVVDNGTQQEAMVKLYARVFNSSGDLVTQTSSSVLLNAHSVKNVELPVVEVHNPNLWSPENPELYTVKIELSAKDKFSDIVTVRHGFRWFKFTADKGFFLNGKPYLLNGVNRHQDYYGKGNAVPLSVHYHDIKLMKEAGINWLRLAHYQQDDYVLQLCDQLGLLVWEEIPYVNNTPKDPSFKKALESMMIDMINQHFNHPSIILWGMGNEVWMKNRGDGKSTIQDILVSLNDIIHREDPVRKSVFVNGDNDRPLDLKVYEIPDVFGYNLYRGWYKDDYKSLTQRVMEIHNRMPEKPLIISEFGAGSDINIHTENPSRQDFSLEYQNDFLESHLQQFQKMDWLCGKNKWAFADFGAAHRGDSKPHVNQKGLLTWDRKKKDAFYLLKSYWSSEPVVYIESPYWKVRSGNPQKTYRVFSNMDEVELFLNGRSLGIQKDKFEWVLNLKEGKNVIRAKGKKGKIVKKHRIKVMFHPDAE